MLGMQASSTFERSINVIPIISTGYRRKITLNPINEAEKAFGKIQHLYLKAVVD